MLAINKVMAKGRGLSPVLIRRAHTVELGWDQRQKSRIEATDSAGRALGIFLPRGTVLRGGDVLVAEDGSLVRVLAAPQAVLVVTHCAQHGTPFDLLRAAYHLGNRHVPLELQPDRLLLEPDHVLADMLRHQHLIVTEALTAFEPEGGAYGAGHGGGHEGHDHGHEGHDHGHEGHDHGHVHAPAATASAHTPAVQDPAPAVRDIPPAAQGHDHGHDHGHAHDPDHDHDPDHGHGHGPAGHKHTH